MPISNPALPSVQLLQAPVTATNATYSSSTATIPGDDTIPQNTEGTQILSVTITPVSSTSTLYLTALVHGAITAANGITATIFKSGSSNALAAQTMNLDSGNALIFVRATTPTGTTNPITITVRVGLGAAGTLYLNGNSTSRIFGGVRFSSIEVLEIE